MKRASDNGSVEAFNKAFDNYLRWNKREQGPLINNRARRINWKINKRLQELAPSKGKIETDVTRQGYHIRRGKTQSGKTRTVKQEITARKRSVKFLSVSFWFKEWRGGKQAKNANLKSRSRRQKAWELGRALLRVASGVRKPFAEIKSYLHGVSVQDRKHRVVDKVLRSEIDDMEAYVARKHQEKINRRLHRVFERGLA
ncbi:MAG: hypothetical protein AAFX93_18595 [Verrucomicrobiota bacterium]